MRTSKSLQKKMKLVRVLHDKKTRNKEKKIILEGIRALESAVNSSIDFNFILYSKKLVNTPRGAKLLKKIDKLGVEHTMISNDNLLQIAQTETSQGVIAIAEQKEYVLSQIDLENKFCFLVLLDSVQDPGNVGTIIRTAEAAGANGVILSKGCVDVYNSKTIRSSMGAIFNIPVVKTQNLKDTVDFLKKKGVRIFATDVKAKEQHFNVRYSGKSAILLGNEAQGLKSDIISKADEKIKIPIMGKSESINVATAASVVIYERVRQNWKYLTRTKK